MKAPSSRQSRIGEDRKEGAEGSGCLGIPVVAISIRGVLTDMFGLRYSADREIRMESEELTFIRIFKQATLASFMLKSA